MVTNQTIKKEIRETIQQVQQWHELGNIQRYSQYAYKLEVLVEILEADNCGSVGGFDKGQPYTGNTIKGLYGRAQWVLNK